MSDEKRIICPTCGQEKEIITDPFIIEMYHKFPNFKILCKKMHSEKIMAGEACLGCIKAATVRILEQYEEAHK